MSESAYLTVAAVASELEMTADGVYKLIRRGTLPVIRRSERGIRIARWSLEAYKRSLNHPAPIASRPTNTSKDIVQLQAAFQEETGRFPEDFVAAWKRNEIEDNGENANRLVRALSLRGAEPIQLHQP